jgi:hypothetical protein
MPGWGRTAGLGLGLAILAGLCLRPALGTGYYNEDIPHSLARGMFQVRGFSYAQGLAWHLDVLRHQGRFFPGTPLLFTGVHYLMPSVLAYKATLVVATVAVLLLFAGLVRRLTGEPDVGVLAGLATLSLVQFRMAPDAVLGYYLQMQVVLAGLFLSLLALLAYLEGGRRRWLAASAACYGAITLTYEPTYLFLLMHLLLIARARRDWPGRLRAAWPLAAVVGLCALVSVVVRLNHDVDHYIHRLNADPWAFARAVGHQLTVAVPLSYLAGDPHEVFARPGRWALVREAFRDPGAVGVAAVAFALLVAAARRRGDAPAPGARPWAATTLALGTMLVVLPTLLTAPSPFHREQYAFGVGWIGTLIQVHGMGLVLATLAWRLAASARGGGAFATRKAVALALPMAMVLGVTFRANEHVAACLYAPPDSPDFRARGAWNRSAWDVYRRHLEAALRAGLLDDVPEGSLLLPERDYMLWHDPEYAADFYATYTGRTFRVATPWALEPARPGASALRRFAAEHPERVYRLRDVPLGPRSGYVVLSGPSPDAARLFVRAPHLDGRAARAGMVVRSGGAPDAGPALALADLRALASGAGWGLYALPDAAAGLAPESLRVAFEPRRARPVTPPVPVEVREIAAGSPTATTR